MVRYILFAAIVACSVVAGPAGAATQKAKPEMELHMEARNVEHGLPRQFRFTLRNMSDHDIRLPEPMLGCSDNRGSGAVKLVVRFVPASAAIPAPAGGCGADFGGPRAGILAQAKSWVVLRPGGYLERSADAEKMHLQDQGAGSYELSAEYLPPAFSPAEQHELAKAGIEYPHAKLLSEVAIFRKTP